MSLHRQRVGAIRATLLAIVLSALFPGCAPKQQIPLVVSPQPVTVYLDREELEEVPEVLELEADRDHRLFFKRPGYRSQLIVLTTTEVDGKPRLEPADIRVELQQAIKTTRRLEVELEE
jgi:hypothetical protein